jgi:Myb-like DNA-binding domain
MKWTVVEARQLEKVVKDTNDKRVNWRSVSSRMGGKFDAAQCRNKWNSMAGKITNERSWKKSERDLLRLVCTQHPKAPDDIPWDVIKRHFVNRTAAQCRSEWARIKGISYKKPRWAIEVLATLCDKGPAYCYDFYKDRSLAAYERQYRRLLKTIK